ncbi:flagellar filament capping protein FliD [Erythrobacter crassostreae]|uniref:Flagellar hook-associated protein 2 n=1 Tax=Erythrobacter crassostreae TaxID=2828328 RepID=A0A9X1JKE3_9SPHN|nr:flagellar filament capping protein FliD [Erythrobacter crassostrea]MBV7258940.1 flagellar filament capping protein FliD [Erythrobacter crassostrea]
MAVLSGMENVGASIISSLGAGSGVNFIQLAEDISDATYSFQRDDLAARNSALEARISAASLLRNSLSQLASALGDRVRNGDLAPQASISDPSVAAVTTAAGTSPSGSYTLEVSQLAQSQTLVSQSYTSADDLVGEGSLTIRFGAVDGPSFTEDTTQSALNITVEDTDTLTTLASKISIESGGDLQAYVAQGSGGSQLVIKGRDGADNGFVLEPASSALIPTQTPGDLSYLAWSPATDNGELRQASQDAIFELDTVEMRSANNTVTGLPEGMTLELTGTNTGAPADIAFSNDSGAITTVMADFVAALNDLTAQLNEFAAAQGGALGNDPGAREFKRDLARLSSEIIMPNAAEGEPNTLADLGLSLNRDGTFRLDTERLNETLAQSPEGAAAMFTNGPFGVFATMDNLARANILTSDPGSLGGSVSRYEDQIERNEARLERIAEQQDNLRERLTRNLVTAERQISASQSTLGFLQQQIDIWNGSN